MKETETKSYSNFVHQVRERQRLQTALDHQKRDDETGCEKKVSQELEKKNQEFEDEKARMVR